MVQEDKHIINASIIFYLNKIPVEERLDLIADFYHKIPIRLQVTLSTEHLNKDVSKISFTIEGNSFDLNSIYEDAVELARPGCLVTYGK